MLIWGTPCKEPRNHHAGRKPTSQEETIWRQILRQPPAVPPVSAEEPGMLMEKTSWTSSLVKSADASSPSTIWLQLHERPQVRQNLESFKPLSTGAVCYVAIDTAIDSIVILNSRLFIVEPWKTCGQGSPQLFQNLVDSSSLTSYARSKLYMHSCELQEQWNHST